MITNASPARMNFQWFEAFLNTAKWTSPALGAKAMMSDSLFPHSWSRPAEKAEAVPQADYNVLDLV